MAYRKMEFNPQTGKLEVDEAGERAAVSATKMASSGFFGGRFTVPDDREHLIMGHTDRGFTNGREITVESMHISCQSDTYQPGHNYAGVIIYEYDGKSDWRTANNTHCKSGYIVIQDTNSDKVKKWIGIEPGAVHGAVYRNAFGESVSNAHVVGEGFSLQHEAVEKFGINSSVFNNPIGSDFHDHRRRMHELTEHCIRRVVEYWKTAGPSWIIRRNFEIKQLLKDLPQESINKSTCERMAGVMKTILQ